MKTEPLLLLITLISFLTACGGGGSSGDNTNNDSNNRPTVIAPASLNTSEDITATVQISASDADDDPLSFSISNQPSHGQANISGAGVLQYIPEQNYHGTDSLTVMVSDGKSSVILAISIIVTAVNDAPVLTNQNFIINEDQPLTQQIAASDADGDTLTYSIVSQPNNGNATISSSGLLQYTPAENYSGSDSLSLTVTDGGLTAQSVVQITINPVNDTPVMAMQSFNTQDARVLNSSIEAYDIEDDTLSFTIEEGHNLPSGVTFDLNEDGSFSYSNTTTTNTSVIIPVQVSDGELTTTRDITFTTTTDRLFTQQWHLNSTGQNAFSGSSASSGHDINIGTLHYSGVTGSGVKVAVVDSGLEIAHPDLTFNVLPGRSWDYANSDNDPTPLSTEGDHGTSVSGLIAARAFNGIGGRGVAPEASLLGFNWLETQLFSQWLDSHGASRPEDAQSGDANYGRTSDVLIINESYGITSSGPVSFFDTWNDAAEAHNDEVTSNNNDGRGVLMVKSAGNSFEDVEVNYEFGGDRVFMVSNIYSFDRDTNPRLSSNIAGTEQESSSFYHTVISALNADEDDPLASYSSVGASVWISAPGGEYGTASPAMITTDLTGCSRGYAQTGESGFDGNDYSGTSTFNPGCDYTSRFNGTSAAAPVASGVAALIFSVNENLTWRDVRHILASTARKVDADFAPVIIDNDGNEFIAEPGWITNDAGYDFHNWYGFGMVDATAAVAMAQDPSYTLLPALQVTDFISPADNSSVAIPENNTGVTKTINVTQSLIVEAVQVQISATHGRDADLAIELISPDGTVSMVLQPQSMLIEDQMDGHSTTDFNNTVLLTNAFYGENALGEWTVRITDTNSGDFSFGALFEDNWYIINRTNNAAPGTLDAVSIRIYGHSAN